MKTKTELAIGLVILRQLGHLDLSRSAAFRPPLTKGLALSRNHLSVQLGMNEESLSILKLVWMFYQICCIKT